MADSAGSAPDALRCGEHARDLIAARLARLVSLQADVLADHDPEPLHQMRVSFRRLRSSLEQFGPALVLLDAIVRLLPGVMGKQESGEDESFENGLLEYPHYTRPREWEGRSIPDILLSGDHKKIAECRRKESERITKERRPDLVKK